MADFLAKVGQRWTMGGDSSFLQVHMSFSHLPIVQVLQEAYNNAMGATLGAVLKRYRIRAGLSQEAAAEAVDSTASYLSQLETGSRSPSWPWVYRYTKVLQVSFWRILQEAGLIEPGESDIEGEIAALVKQVPAFAGIFEFARDHPEKLPEVLRYARYLLAGAPEEEPRAAPEPRHRTTEADTA